MKLIEDIRIKAGHHFLKKELEKPRKVQATNWAEASEIALIYKIDDERSFQHVKWYINELHKKYGNKKIMALGYFDEKEPALYLSHGLNTDYFTKKDLNWYGRPSANSVTHFVNEQYDLLIDLTHYDCVPLRFVLHQSKAKFKIGRFSEENTTYYDLLLSVPEDSLSHYMDQVDHYLNMIRT